MAQSKINVAGINNPTDAERLISQTSNVAGVKFVNVNAQEGYIIVTHGDGFDADAFKAAVNSAGFSA